MGAETNISYNCLDRHVEAGHGDRVACYWEGNDLNEDCTVTYSQLLNQAQPPLTYPPDYPLDFRSGKHSCSICRLS